MYIPPNEDNGTQTNVPEAQNPLENNDSVQTNVSNGSDIQNPPNNPSELQMQALILPAAAPNVDIDISDLTNSMNREEMKNMLAFITAIQNTSLDDPNTGMDADATERLCNPIQEVLTVVDPDFCLSLDLYLATSDSSD